jgi:hypothetical protein
VNKKRSLSVGILLKCAATAFLAAGIQSCARIDKSDRSVNNYNYSARMMAVGVKGEPEHSLVSNISNEEPEVPVGQKKAPSTPPDPHLPNHISINNYRSNPTVPVKEEMTLDQLIHENLMLQAKQRNAWLKKQLQ